MSNDMLKALQETKKQYNIERAALQKDANPIIINMFFTFEDELNKMLHLYTKIVEIRENEKNNIT